MTIKFKPNYAIGSEYSSVVTTVPHSKYLLYDYTYTGYQQGATSILSQSGGQALSIMPYDMARKAVEHYYGSNALSESVRPFCMFFGNRHEGSYYRAIVVTNFVAKQGYAFSVTGTGAQVADGLSMQTDGYSDKFFYIYALKRSTFTVDGVQTESNLVDKIIGKYRISDIEDNINYVQDITSFNIVGGSSWVENRLYGTSGLCTANIPKATSGRSRIPISELKYFKQKQDAYNQSVLLMRSGITNAENYSQLTIGNTTYNLLRADSTISDTQIQSINASKLSGKVPLASMPAAALERVHNVADETARFALTTATVHNGDVVYQQDDHSQYYVVDDTNLNSAAGYKKITKVALQVPWSGLTNKPVYFQPAAHSHGNITNDGRLGETANLPLITGLDGAIVTSSFGTEAHTFCEGNDSRLSDAREPLNHGSDKVTALTGYKSATGFSGTLDTYNASTILLTSISDSLDPYMHTYVDSSTLQLMWTRPYALAYYCTDFQSNKDGSKPFLGMALSSSYEVSFLVATNLKCKIGDRFRPYHYWYGRYIDTEGISSKKFYVYLVEYENSHGIVKAIIGEYNISDVTEANLGFQEDLSNRNIIVNNAYSTTSYNQTVYTLSIWDYVDTSALPPVMEDYIQATDNLNTALAVLDKKIVSHKNATSMLGYSTQTKSPITTSDSFKVALGKIEGGYLARKYATADDIGRVLFGDVDYDYDAVYNMLEALGVSIDEDGNFHDIPINGYTATNEVLALNADGTVSHENSYPSSYTRKFGVESYEMLSQNYLSNGKLYCKDQYYANNSDHVFSSAVQAVLNFFIVSKFAPSEIKQPIMLTNMAVGAFGYGAIAVNKASGDPINCIIFDTEGRWGTVGYSNLSSTFADSLETTGIVTINSSTIYVDDSALSYVNLYIYNGNSNLYGFSSGTSGWRSEVQLNVQSVVNYLSYVLALKNTTISAVLNMPFYSA